MLKKEKKILIGAGAGVLTVGATLAIALPLALKDDNGSKKDQYITKTSAEYKVLNKTGIIEKSVSAAKNLADTIATGSNYVFDKDSAKISFNGSIATFKLQSTSVAALADSATDDASKALKPVTANATISFDLSTVEGSINGLNKLSGASITFVNHEDEVSVVGTKDETKNTYTYKDKNGADLKSNVEQVVTIINTSIENTKNINTAVEMQKALDELSNDSIVNGIISNGGKTKDKTTTATFANAADQSVSIDGKNYTYTISNSSADAAKGTAEFDLIINNAFASSGEATTEARTITGIKVTGLSKQQSNQDIANEIKASLEKITVSTANEVAAVASPLDFDVNVLKGIGTISGLYPSLPDGVTLKYTVAKIETPKSSVPNTGVMKITINVDNQAATGAAATATADISISVNNPAVQKVVDVKTALEKMSIKDIPNVVSPKQHQPFTEAVLSELHGTISGTFPTDVSTVDMTYSVGEISKGSQGDLTVTITDKTTPTISETAVISLFVKADKPVDLIAELGKINASYQSTKNVDELKALQNKTNVSPDALGISVGSSIDSRATLSFDTTTYDDSSNSLGVTAKVTDKISGNSETKTIQITGVQFNGYTQATIDEYRNDTKKAFADAYSDENGTEINVNSTFDSLATIDSILAKANELIQSGVYYKPTPGAKASVSIPEPESDPTIAYKASLIALFNDLYSTDGADGLAQTKIDTTSIAGADGAALKAAATTLMANAYTKATITAGSPANIDVNSIAEPSKDGYSDNALIDYKTSLKQLFDGTFKSANNEGGAPDLSNIDSAASIDDAKTAAKDVIAFGTKKIVPGTKATPTISEPTFDAYLDATKTQYQADLKAQFANKYSTDGADGATQGGISTDSITGTPEEMLNAAKVLANNVYSKHSVTAGASENVTIDSIPSNDTWKGETITKFKDDVKALYNDTVKDDGTDVNLGEIDAATTIEGVKEAQSKIGEVFEKGSDGNKKGDPKTINMPNDPDKDKLSDTALTNYKTRLINKFANKYSTDGADGSVQNLVDTKTIEDATTASDVSEAASNLTTSVFSKATWTPGTKEDVTPKSLPNKDAYTDAKAREYVDGLVNAVKDLYTSEDENQSLVDVTDITGTPDNAKKVVDRIITNGVFNKVTITLGVQLDKQSDIDGVSLPTTDTWKAETITKYKENLVILFKDAYETNGGVVGVQNKVNTSGISSANSIADAKSNASSITAYLARNVVAGTANSKTIPDVPKDPLQPYKDTLIALFKNKYDKATSDQTLIDTANISSAKNQNEAKTAAENLENAGVFDKYKVGAKKSVTVVTKPKFDAVTTFAPAVDTEATSLYL